MINSVVEKMASGTDPNVLHDDVLVCVRDDQSVGRPPRLLNTILYERCGSFERLVLPPETSHLLSKDGTIKLAACNFKYVYTQCIVHVSTGRYLLIFAVMLFNLVLRVNRTNLFRLNE